VEPDLKLAVLPGGVDAGVVALLDSVEFGLGRHLGRLRLGPRHLWRWLRDRGLEETQRGDGGWIPGRHESLRGRR
jgi:hypothetical protein